MMAPGPGRRPGVSATKARILEVARKQFADKGIHGASVRSIATEADVDPALVLHYFESKARLFFTAVEMPVDPSLMLTEAFASNHDPGAFLIRHMLATLDEPDAQRRIVSIMRSAASDEDAADMMRDILTQRAILPMVKTLDTDHADLRATLIGSLFAGLVFARYVVRVPPLVKATNEELAAMYGPSITHYLQSPLPSKARSKKGKRK